MDTDEELAQCSAALDTLAAHHELYSPTLRATLKRETELLIAQAIKAERREQWEGDNT